MSDIALNANSVATSVASMRPTATAVEPAQASSASSAVDARKADVVMAQEAPTGANQVAPVTQVTYRNLTFSLDEDLGRVVVTIRDSESNETIRQIPSEEMLDISRRLLKLRDESAAQGVFVQSKA